MLIHVYVLVVFTLQLVIIVVKCVFVQGLGMLRSPVKVMLQLSTSYYNMAKSVLQPG